MYRMGTIAYRPRAQPLATQRPQRGAGYRAPARGPAVSLAASRGNDTSRRGGRPLAGPLPTSKGCCHLRKGSDDVEGARWVRASF
ncbi:hypothetical protein B296_00052615 [Ensete ventricosum]|uniref:Uncharacterized protein n=1 Tax=Ensete ventricosum TaxID=4639 RepID=A0A426WWF0_ENSVE|nr:hypothetical protein B296_00052615 [Ensete ventricosum]